MLHGPNRRQFLKFSAAATAGAALPENLKRALAIAPNTVTGTIQDVEHVVILMQENRSFDHYFGCLKGVRGYGDPRAEHRPDGKNVFAQPDGKGGYVLPFLFNTAHTSSACLASLDHSWKNTQAEWNNWDTWVPHKTPMTMGHFTRNEIPYYYALADAFTICDAYHARFLARLIPIVCISLPAQTGWLWGMRASRLLRMLMMATGLPISRMTSRASNRLTGPRTLKNFRKRAFPGKCIRNTIILVITLWPLCGIPECR